MQGCEVQYSQHRLWPEAGGNDGRPRVCLDGASPALVRWLCAILSPDLGWFPKNNKLPPWAAFLSSDVQITIGTATREPTSNIQEPPGPSEAMHLLLELCHLFGLGSDNEHDEKYESLPPYRVAFFAALMLPFYRFMDLRPQFNYPRLTTSKGSVFSGSDEALIRKYMEDMPYFMTQHASPITRIHFVEHFLAAGRRM